MGWGGQSRLSLTVPYPTDVVLEAMTAREVPRVGERNAGTHKNG